MASIKLNLAKLENAALVRRDVDSNHGYHFMHALTQEAVYNSLLLGSKRELNQRVAEAYEALYPADLDELASLLAHHYAEAQDDPKTLKYAVLAGDQAAAVFANIVARTLYLAAMDALTRLPDTIVNRRTRIEIAFQYVECAWTTRLSEQDVAMLQELESVAQILPGPDGIPGSDAVHLAKARLGLGAAHLVRNEVFAALAYYQQVLEMADQLQDEPQLLAGPKTVIGGALVQQGYFLDAVPLLTAALEASAATPHGWQRYGAISYWAFSLAARSHLPEALSELAEGLHRALETDNLTAAANMHLAQGVVHWMARDFAKMLQVGRTALDLATQTADPIFQYMGLGLVAQALSGLQQPEESRSLLAQALALRAQLGDQVFLADWLSASHAETAFRLEDWAQALTLCQQTVAFAQSVGGIYAEACARRTWAQVLLKTEPFKSDEAAEHLSTALAYLERGGAVLEAARTHVVWGELCLLRDETALAREHFDQAAAPLQAAGLTAEWNLVHSMLPS